MISKGCSSKVFQMHVMDNEAEIKVIAYNEVANKCRETFKVSA